jgi:hypothetical protein
MSLLDRYIRDLLSRGEPCKVEPTCEQLHPCGLNVVSGHALLEPLIPSRLLVIPDGFEVTKNIDVPEEWPNWPRYDALILHYLHVPPCNQKATLSQVLDILETTAAASGKWVVVYRSCMHKEGIIDRVAHSRHYIQMGKLGWVWHT